MSERFEREIQEWYASRSVNLEYLDLAEKPTVSIKEVENNINYTYNRLSLFATVSFKNFHKILEKQERLEDLFKICENKIKHLEGLTKRGFNSLTSDIQSQKPLTKQQVLDLVLEIAEQPKIVEKEALKLTEDLNQKVQRVEHLLHEVKRLITG